MNNRFKLIRQSVVSAFHFSAKAVNAMVAVKGGIPLVRVFVRLLTPLGLGVTSSRVRVVVVVLRKFHTLYRSCGTKGLTLYLKATSVALQQAVNGHVLKDVGPVSGARVSRTNLGLPRIIPAIHREMIRSGDTKIMKLYLTLFSLYRVLEFDGRLKLHTVTNPSSAIGSLDMLKYMSHFRARLNLARVVGFDHKAHEARYGQFAGRMMPNFVLEFLKSRYAGLAAFPIMKGAPGTFVSGTDEDLSYSISTHPVVLVRAAVALRNSPLISSVRYFLNFMPNNNKVRVAFETASEFSGFTALPHLGKLSTKVESAGKIRVFAMVDAWTQWLMSPIHELYFAILRRIPQDGTFDQLRPLDAAKAWPDAFSLDLSAATDRLPLYLQEALLESITGERAFARNWARLLVERDYVLRYKKVYGRKTYDHPDGDRACSFTSVLRYAVGQPMGALSSWASLALTHHYLVQYSAWEACVVKPGVWFKDYAILGDDLVIGNRRVAVCYLRVLKDIGMEVGLHKSLISGGNIGLEFAKRTFHRGVDISPIPLTEFAAALSAISEMRSFAVKYHLTFPALVKTLGYGYTVLGSLTKRFSSFSSRIKVVFLAITLPFDEGSVKDFFETGAARGALYKVDFLAIAEKFREREFLNLARSALRVIRSVRAGQHIYNLGYRPFEKLLSSSADKLIRSAEFFIDVRVRMDVLGPKGPCSFIAVGIEPFEGSDHIPEESIVGVSRENVIRDSWVWKPWVRVLGTFVDMLVLPAREKILTTLQPFESGWIPAMVSLPPGFADIYLLYLESAREAAKASPATLSLGRVLPSERGSDPIQIKLWRRWSSVLQGTKLLDSSANTPTNKDQGRPGFNRSRTGLDTL